MIAAIIAGGMFWDAPELLSALVAVVGLVAIPPHPKNTTCAAVVGTWTVRYWLPATPNGVDVVLHVTEMCVIPPVFGAVVWLVVWAKTGAEKINPAAMIRCFMGPRLSGHTWAG